MSFSFHNIHLQIGNRTILAGASAQLPTKGIVGLIGRNGAGKTTLLEVMTAYRKANSGTIVLDGQERQASRTQDKSTHIGYLSQVEHLHFPFRVEQYLELALTQKLPRAQLSKHPIIKELSLTSMLNAWMHELSGGERQRVRLAQTFLEEKSIVLLDEPFNFLDHWQSQACQEFLKNRSAHSLLLVVIHDLALAQDLCDSLLILSEGRITHASNPTEALTPDAIANISPEKW